MTLAAAPETIAASPTLWSLGLPGAVRQANTPIPAVTAAVTATITMVGSCAPRLNATPLL